MSTPPVHSSSASDWSRESVDFYRHRVALFGLSSAAFVGGFFALRLVELAISVAGLDASLYLHAAAVAPLLGIWLLCRREGRSLRFVRSVELVGLLGASAGLIGMGAYIPTFLRPEYIVMLALTYLFIARSIYVPSSTRRTFALVGIMGIPLMVGGYLLYKFGTLAGTSDFVPVLVEAHGSVMGELTREQLSRVIAWEMFMWWSGTTALATAASHVIYGPRREVREARRLGQYTLEEQLGEGGMGVVYRAGHAMLRRPTAVKLLPPERSSERDVARFEREVQLTASLSHPNTVTIFDYGRTADGVFYYAMELLEGASLDVAVAVSGPFPAERVAHVLYNVAAALTEAHGVGLIHRDLKPGNIILCRQGGVADVPKVVDFGLVKQMTGSDEPSLTQAGAIAGTPHYMSPESIKNADEVGGRSDIYSLGAVAYYLLTGTTVFAGSNALEVCGHHLHTRPEPPSARLGRPVSGDLEALVLECLSKQPAERPATARVLQERVARCASFGRWDEERAESWWRDHEMAVASRQATRHRGLTEWTALTTASAIQMPKGSERG